jgi:tRNA A-37 threonylcarbamoyl transferase component Bud32
VVDTIGEYQVIEQLGHGGQASVYRAVSQDGRDVVVKVWPRLGTYPDQVRRKIEREAELVSQIRHPGVVALVDTQVDADPPYLVFDYIDGSTLEEWVGRNGPARGEQARRIVVGTLRSLVEVHAAPIAHLDVKPGNIILRTGPEGIEPVLIDFGIARPADVTHTRLTGMSAPYASPEQMLLQTAYTPSDLFSWASVVYFALTGEAPFGLQSAVAQSRILDPDWLAPRAPFEESIGDQAPGLWDILVDCWRRDPVLRHPLLVAPSSGMPPTRPGCDTFSVLGAVEQAFGGPARPKWRRGRIDPHKPGPSPWHELGVHLRHRRRHGAHPMTRRQLASQRELLGQVNALTLWAIEMGWREPPYDLVSVIDSITEGQGYLRHLYVCARGSEAMGMMGRPRGSRYPVPGDRTEQHEDTPALLRARPWQVLDFPVVIRNAGSVPWGGRYLIPVGPITGTETVPVRGTRFPVPATGPGELARIAVPVRAPGWPAVYRQRLKMVDDEGAFCFPLSNALGIELMIQVVRDADE